MRFLSSGLFRAIETFSVDDRRRSKIYRPVEEAPVPKPSPAKKSRTKKAARPVAIRAKQKRKVVARKTKAPVRKATIGSRNSLTVPKRAQASHSKRGRTDQPSVKLTPKHD